MVSDQTIKGLNAKIKRIKNKNIIARNILKDTSLSYNSISCSHASHSKYSIFSKHSSCCSHASYTFRSHKHVSTLSKNKSRVMNSFMHALPNVTCNYCGR